MKADHKNSNDTPLPRWLNPRRLSAMLMRSLLTIVCGVVLTASTQAGAVLINLAPINVDEDFDPATIDIYADVTADGDQVRFEFYNDSDIDSSIKSIYFEDGVLDGIAGFEFGTGTLFEAAAEGGNLPAGNSLAEKFEEAYSAVAIPPAPHNGIGMGEQLTIIMNLDSGATFEDLLEALGDDSLRIGVYVIALPDGSSLSVVSNPVPKPASVAILGTGAIFLAAGKKRKIWH